MQNPMRRQGGGKPRLVKIEQVRRHRFIDAVQPPLLRQCRFARVILIADRLPSCGVLRHGLVIHRDHGIGQIIKQGLKLGVKIGQPMFHALVFTPRTDCLIERIIISRSPKFDAVILSKPRDCGLVHHNLGDGRKR